MKLLAIDPGTRHLGWAVYAEGTVVTDGLWEPEWTSPLDYLTQLEKFLQEKRAEYDFDTLAAEQMFLSFAHGAKSAALLNVSVDQMLAWCKERALSFHAFSNGTVKKAVTGDGKADKGLVRRQTIHLVTETTRKAINRMSDAAKTRRDLLENVTDAHAIAQTTIVHLSKPPSTTKKGHA